jgi:hypothetical protein
MRSKRRAKYPKQAISRLGVPSPANAPQKSPFYPTLKLKRSRFAKSPQGELHRLVRPPVAEKLNGDEAVVVEVDVAGVDVAASKPWPKLSHPPPQKVLSRFCLIRKFLPKKERQKQKRRTQEL